MRACARALVRARPYVAHVLREQVLQRLADRVALLHDAFAALVARTRRVGQQGGATDDALQPVLERRPTAHLVVRQRVHDDLLLETRNAEDVEHGEHGWRGTWMVWNTEDGVKHGWRGMWMVWNMENMDGVERGWRGTWMVWNMAGVEHGGRRGTWMARNVDGVKHGRR